MRQRTRLSIAALATTAAADTAGALLLPPAGQHLAGLVHHLDIVMVLSPVITHEQPHARSRQQNPDTHGSQQENHQQANKTVLTPIKSRHDIPAAINSPGHRQGHGLSSGLKAQEANVLTCRRPPHPESARRRAP
jgi:predicted lipid-binding transport protein (Tim44 family)